MPRHVPVLYRMAGGVCCAFFPTLAARDDELRFCTHEAKDNGVVCAFKWYKKHTRAAERWQYMALHKSLRAIYGRDLRIVPCITQKMRAERRKAII